jgi:hypothetical protein
LLLFLFQCLSRKLRDFLRKYARVRFFPALSGFEPRTSALPLGYIITYDQQWDIFILSSLSNILYNLFHSYNNLNEKLFNYKVVDLVASYNFRIYFFFHLMSFENFKIWNSKFKLIFGCQNNLNWKNFKLQSCRSGWGYNFV